MSRMDLWISVGILLLLGVLLRFLIRPFSHISTFQVQAPSQVQETQKAPESWCLVTESTLGRVCAKATCAPTSRFTSRESCEMTEASALPLGITQQGGTTYTPFLTPNISRATTF